LLASLALLAVLWSGDDAASAAPLTVPIEPIGPVEPLDNGLDQPVVARPYLFTTLETALVIGVGAVWYLRHGSGERWGRAMQWQNWRRKLFTTDEVTFDGDHFNTNSVGHPFDGTVYYQIARGNGLSPGAAFVSTVLASTFWEYFIEIPENPSLNDLIITPAAGAVIGEATYRLGRYLSQSGPGVARCGGALLFAPVATLNEEPLCHRRPRLLPKARLGLAAGFGRAVFDGNATRTEFALRLGADVVSQSDYERPGNGNVAVAPGQWVSLIADGRFGAGEIDGVWFHAGTVWGGRYERHYVAVTDDTDVPVGTPARGWGTLIGLGSVFDYRLRDLPQVHDRSATAGVLGPMFELSLRRDIYFRLSASMQYAFAIIGSIAYRENYRTLLGQVIKTSLGDSGYYYGQGVVSAVTASVDLGSVGFIADARGAWYWSFDAGDPAQSNIQYDVTLHDARLYLSAAMWTRPAVGPFRFGLAVEHIRRTSNMLDINVRSTEFDAVATTAVGF
jgi:hypothetical protein